MREGKENQAHERKEEKGNKREITGKGRGERRCFPTFSGRITKMSRARGGKKSEVFTQTTLWK